MRKLKDNWFMTAIVLALVLTACAGKSEEKKEESQSQYLYKMGKTIHVDSRCTVLMRLVHEGKPTTWIKKTDYTGAESFCPRCVSDADYEELQRLASENRGEEWSLSDW